MGIEIYSGPGSESKRSTRYLVSVSESPFNVNNATETFVYGVTEVSPKISLAWSPGSSVEMSWLTYGTDITTVAEVSLVGGADITSVAVYPTKKNYSYYIDEGKLYITLPVRSKVWLEINGNRKDPLFLFADELKPAIPVGSVTYTNQTSVAPGGKLYFPPGIHTIGQQFKINEGGSVYLDGGAWVVGSFDIANQGHVTITGPGVLSGQFTTWNAVHALPWPQNSQASCIYGGDFSLSHVANTVSRITIVDTPFYTCYGGVNYFYDVKLISPWNGNTDGFLPQLDASNSSRSGADHCFSYVGDDNIRIIGIAGNCTVNECVIANSLSASIMLGYWPETDFGNRTLMTNNYVISNQVYLGGPNPPATEAGIVIHCFVDGGLNDSAKGRFHVTIDGLTIDGLLPQAPVFALKNRLYPHGTTASAYGQIADFVIKNVHAYTTPTVKSQLIGLDPVNTPHNITFQDVNIGGTNLSASNWPTYVTSNQYPYGISVLESQSAIIGKWRSMTGRRYVVSTDIASVDVEAYANPDPAAEGGVDRVVFTITDNNGAVHVRTVTQPSLRFPNLSVFDDSPLTNVASPVAPVYCYGIDIPLNTFPVGVIRVNAQVFAANGSSFTLPSRITIFSDIDGGDRRPSTKLIYASPSGNDANPGTIGSPVQTIQKAITLCRSNPAGSTQADADCGGAIIILEDGSYIWGGRNVYDSTQWHTSDDRWLQIISVSGNALISSLPLGTGTSYPESYVFARGWNGGGSCRIQVTNCKFVNKGGAVFVGDGTPSSLVDVHVWIDGGESYTTAPRSGNHTVRFKELSGEIVTIDNNLGKRYVTSHYRHHVENGWHGWTLVMDCVLQYYTGIAFQDTGNETFDACNVLIDDQQAYSNPLGSVTEGYVWVVDGSRLSVTIPASGQMRVTCSGTPATLGQVNATGAGFAAQFQNLVGSTVMGAGFRRFPAATNNGVFQVLNTGTDGQGNEYVTVANPVAVAQSGVGGGAFTRTEMFTGRITDQMQYNDILHPDVLQWNGDRRNSLASNIAVRNVRESQSWFTSGHALTNCWLYNVSDGQHGIIANFANSSLRYCGFIRCTFTGTWDFTGGSNYANNCFVNCVITKSSQLPFASSYVNSCHWIDTGSFGADAAGGINPHSGSWFNADPSVSPYTLTPLAGKYGQTLGLFPSIPQWEWAASTGGVLKQVGLYDYQGIAAPSSGAVSATATTQNFAFSIFSATINRAILAASQSLTLTQQSATAKIAVNMTGALQSLTFTQHAATGKIAVSVTHSTLTFAITQQVASAKVAAGVTSGLQNLSLSQFSATPVVGVVVAQSAPLNLSIAAQAATGSGFNAPTLAVQNLTFSIFAATLVKTVSGAGAVQNLTLTQQAQPQNVVGDSTTLPLTFTIIPATASGSVKVTAAVQNLTATPNPQPQITAAYAASQSLTLTPVAQTAVGSVTASYTDVPRLTLVAYSAYGVGAGGFQSSPLSITLVQLGASAGISAVAQHVPQTLSIGALAQTGTVATSGLASRLNLQMIQIPTEATGAATVVAITITLTLTPQVQTARSGAQASAVTQTLVLEQKNAQAGSSAQIFADWQFLSILPLAQTAVIPANTTSSLQNLTFSILPASALVEVLGGYEEVPQLQFDTFDPHVDGGRVIYQTVADIPKGKTRDRLNDEIPAVPVPAEDWRILQVD